MQVNTNLQTKDYVRAYKNAAAFIVAHPLMVLAIVALGFAVNTIPVYLFPVKMAAYALLVSITVCITALYYRTGAFDGLVDEFSHQQKVYLPALVAVLCLSCLGFLAAELMSSLFQTHLFDGTLPHNSPGPTVLTMDTLMASALVAGIICIAVVKPYVLAHFCNGLRVPKKQGEQVWYALLRRLRTFVAYMPLIQLVPLGLAAGIDVTGIVVVLSSLFSTFVFFIVFQIKPAQPQTKQTFQLVKDI